MLVFFFSATRISNLAGTPSWDDGIEPRNHAIDGQDVASIHELRPMANGTENAPIIPFAHFFGQF